MRMILMFQGKSLSIGRLMGKCYVDISRNFQFNENTLQIVTIAHNEYKTMVLGIIIICSLVC